MKVQVKAALEVAGIIVAGLVVGVLLGKAVNFMGADVLWFGLEMTLLALAFNMLYQTRVSQLKYEEKLKETLADLKKSN